MARKMSRINRSNKGVSTIIGSLLFMILIAMVMSALFIGLYDFETNAKESITNTQIRAQEKIIIDGMQNDSKILYVTAIHVNNTGSTTAEIRAVYLDSDLLLQPSIDLNAKQAVWIQMPPNTLFEAASKIAVTTEKGIKTVAREGDFIYSLLPPPNYDEGYFGPLQLDYESFSYGTYDSHDVVVSPPGWQPGWHVDTHTQDLVWNITVKDIDERAITLNQYSTLTLVPNAQGAQIPWYIEKVTHKDGSLAMKIQPQEIVTITYRWPSPSNHHGESAPSSQGMFRVFLTFFGNFNELDGTIKPYGQSVPFEAVMVA